MLEHEYQPAKSFCLCRRGGNRSRAGSEAAEVQWLLLALGDVMWV